MLAALSPAPSAAHPLGFTEVRAEIRADKSYRIDVLFDADALVAEVDPGHMTQEDWDRVLAMPPEDLRRRVEDVRATLARSLVLWVDKHETTPRVTFPQAGEPDSGGPAAPGIGAAARSPGGVIRYSGTLPAGAKELAVSPAPAFNTVLLTWTREGGSEPVREVLEAGRTSRPFRLGGGVPQRVGVALQYLRLGFEHILPKGIDHILFVLGLFLLSARLGPLLKQVTAFTVAHSISLALSMYGVVSLPPSVVEPLIAFSIACVAVENLFTSELKPWRPVVVFLFGLLHGLGFAGVLSGLGLPRGEFLTALLTFNVGVELGQLTVILIALLLVGWFRESPRYRSRVVIPVSCAIAVIGLYWSFERAGIGARIAAALARGRSGGN